MMLRFYSLFKQSTDGPCKSRRPAFWDMVGKVKYDAWKRLGDLPREKAMEAYVNELKQIVETMSYTQNVAEFYNSLNEFDMKVEDIALIAPDVIRSKSQENSPYHANTNNTTSTTMTRSDENIQTTSEEIPIPNGHAYGSNDSTEDSSDEDEYIDTVDVR